LTTDEHGFPLSVPSALPAAVSGFCNRSLAAGGSSQSWQGAALRARRCGPKPVGAHAVTRLTLLLTRSSGAQGDSTPTCGLTDTKRVWAAFRNPEGFQMVAGGRSAAATPGLEFGHFARQRRAGRSAQGNAPGNRPPTAKPALQGRGWLPWPAPFQGALAPRSGA